MRKIQIPIIYLADTGEWLDVCGLTYDDEENIVQVDAWDGDGVKTYKNQEFVIDEEKVIPLYNKL